MSKKSNHPTHKGYTQDDYVTTFKRTGSVKATAEALGVVRSTVQKALDRAGARKEREKLLGQLGGLKTTKLALPATGEVKRYILTSAQEGTQVNKTFWERLLMLAEAYDAEVHVSPFSYNTRAYGHEATQKPGAKRELNTAAIGMAPEVQEYITIDRLEIAPKLVFCAEMQILPTAARPLSSLESYTGRASSIFPHAKIAMESVPSMKDEGTKLMYTTGCVTKHNYIQKKAGLKGEFHHAYGALIVEVNDKGHWWVRQLNADSQNRIYDLDVCVDATGVTYGNTVAALVYGDVHDAVIDQTVLGATWGPDGLVDFLEPDTQIFHDFFDMQAQPWQELNNFHRQFEKFHNNEFSIEDELDRAHANYNAVYHRDWAHSVFVRSNHDIKLETYLNTADFRRDLVNAEFYLEAQLEMVRALKKKEKGFKVFEWAMRKRGVPDNVTFLDEDESFIICKNRGGGIECGLHGHLGPNGAKGTPRGLAKMARKLFIGDKHSACIVDGLYCVGTCTGPDVAYTRGPSSWSPTHGVAYENGKRALLTMWNGAFFASREGLFE